MNVLEKILEEIENESKLAHEKMRRCASENPLQFDEAKGYARGVEYVAEIIRSHMDEVDDDWIPCSEQLPEESGHYLVQLSRKLPNEDYSDRVVVLYNAEEKEFMCYESFIIAWQPLPESYKAKKK